MEHLFDMEVAKEYGVRAAVIIRHLQFWIIKNKAAGRNQHDGRTWTYFSVQNLMKVFPYWTVRQIRTVLEKLLSEEVILKGNYNVAGYDHTSWWAFQDENRFVRSDKSICQNGQMDSSEPANGFVKDGEPIPIPTPDKLTDNQPNEGLNLSANELLELDLKIAEGKKTFTNKIGTIFHLNAREANAFALIAQHMVKKCQARELSPNIFTEALKWAKQARASNATNKKGLFVEKIKRETGYRKQKRLLPLGEAAQNAMARRIMGAKY